MSTTDATTTEQVSVPRILADLLMFGQLYRLPDPVSLNVYGDSRSIRLSFTSRAELDSWAAALQCEGSISEQPHQDKVLCNAHSSVRPLGYRVKLDALFVATPHTELPVETLIALDQIAAGVSCPA